MALPGGLAVVRSAYASDRNCKVYDHLLPLTPLKRMD